MLAITESKHGYEWMARGGKWIPVEKMNNQHLVNAIMKLERTQKTATKSYSVLIEEAQRRHLDTKTKLPFCTC
jgi:hypothetical protein